MVERINILNALLLKIAKEKKLKGNITIDPIASDGANYTSELFLATLTAPGEKDVSLFAKVAAIGEKMRQSSPKDIFKTETYFYRVLLKKYKNLEEQFNIPERCRLITPRFYGTNDELYKEAIVLENLTAAGYKVADRQKPMSKEYAFSGVLQLTKLHSLSLALANHYIDDFAETEQTLKIKTPKEIFLQFVNSLLGSVIEATNEGNKELISAFVNNILNREHLLKPSIVPIIVHGDYRGSNLMYKVDRGELQIAMLDFQTIHLGSVVSDLLYFILNGADGDFLEAHFDLLLDYYYDKLSAAMTRFNLKPDSVYSRADFEDELKQKLPEAVALGFCTLLVVTVEADKAPKVDKDLALDSFSISPSQSYKERLNGVIEYFIKRGVIS